MKQMKLSVGVSDFEKIRSDGYYYIDKSGWIKGLLKSGAEVTLLTRPRRFGKTLGMSMLANFFDITKEEREAGNTKDVCKVQVEKALENVSKEDLAKVVIAYEPVWAIGTGKTATSEDANDVIAYIREVVANLYGELANEVRIQYGGSVKPSNVAEIMNQSDIDGALVGGASLEANDYVELVNF